MFYPCDFSKQKFSSRKQTVIVRRYVLACNCFLASLQTLQGLYEKDKSLGDLFGVVWFYFFPPKILFLSFFLFLSETAVRLYVCFLCLSGLGCHLQKLRATTVKGAPDICSGIVSVFYLIVLW